MKVFKIIFVIIFICLMLVFIENETFFKDIIMASNSTINSQKYIFEKQWGSEGNGNGQFKQTTYICADNCGYLYVSDFLNNSIQKFDTNGNFIRKWGNGGDINGQFKGPAGIAIDKEGNIYIADYGNNRIQVFDTDGNFINKWGCHGFYDGEFLSPLALAISPNQMIYVLDSYRIQKFNFSGKFIKNFEFSSQDFDMDTYGDYYFRQIAIDTLGQIYIVYCNGISTEDPFIDESYKVPIKYSSIIYKYDSLDNFVGKWKSCVDCEEHFGGLSITTDSEENIFIADADRNHIKKLSSDGKLITQWGSTGNGEGEFNKPIGIAVDLEGNVYVLDSGNYRIQKFAPNPKF